LPYRGQSMYKEIEKQKRKVRKEMEGKAKEK
jgi:hypothetical protein